MSEKLSSLMDSELDAAEQGVLIEQLGADAELAAKWSRYSLASHLIQRGGDRSPVIGDMSSRIAERIEAEPVVIAPREMTADKAAAQNETSSDAVAVKNNVVQLSPVRAGLIGFALAASVAAVAVFGLNEGLLQSADETDSAAVAQNETGRLEQTLASASTGRTRWDTNVTAHENDLNSLLVEHGEFMPPSGLNGLMAYAKFVSYDAQ